MVPVAVVANVKLILLDVPKVRVEPAATEKVPVMVMVLPDAEDSRSQLPLIVRLNKLTVGIPVISADWLLLITTSSPATGATLPTQFVPVVQAPPVVLFHVL